MDSTCIAQILVVRKNLSLPPAKDGGQLANILWDHHRMHQRNMLATMSVVGTTRVHIKSISWFMLMRLHCCQRLPRFALLRAATEHTVLAQTVHHISGRGPQDELHVM